MTSVKEASLWADWWVFQPTCPRLCSCSAVSREQEAAHSLARRASGSLHSWEGKCGVEVKVGQVTTGWTLCIHMYTQSHKIHVENKNMAQGTQRAGFQSIVTWSGLFIQGFCCVQEGPHKNLLTSRVSRWKSRKDLESIWSYTSKENLVFRKMSDEWTYLLLLSTEKYIFGYILTLNLRVLSPTA